MSDEAGGNQRIGERSRSLDGTYLDAFRSKITKKTVRSRALVWKPGSPGAMLKRATLAHETMSFEDDAERTAIQSALRSYFDAKNEWAARFPIRQHHRAR